MAKNRNITPAAIARYKRYRATDKYREYARNRYHKLPDNKRKARYYVLNAVRSGKLIRPEHCSNCGIKDWGTTRRMIEANHHNGYEPEHWLDIEWLCTTCHKIADGFIKERSMI